jgi:hypothetical protein
MSTLEKSKKTLQQLSNNELIVFMDIIKQRYDRAFWDTYELMAERLSTDFELNITAEDLYYHFSHEPVEVDMRLIWERL